MRIRSIALVGFAALAATLVTWVSSEVVMSADAPRSTVARRDNAPEEGAKAPDFTLTVLDEHQSETDETITLSSFEGERNVVLIFGSYT